MSTAPLSPFANYRKWVSALTVNFIASISADFLLFLMLVHLMMTLKIEVHSYPGKRCSSYEKSYLQKISINVFTSVLETFFFYSFEGCL